METNNQNNQNTNNNNQQENSDKVTKNFEKTMEKLVAVVGGKENIYAPRKVQKDVLDTLVEGLLKERKEALEKEVKADLLALLDKKVAYDKEIKAKEEEFKKVKEQKMKEFTEAANKVFGKVDNIENLAKDYYASLGATKADDSEAVKAS